MPWYENRRGERLWYEESGAGCPIVFLHGWCMSSAVWKYQFEGILSSERLLAPDLRGHGRSQGISGQADFTALSEDLIDFFERLDLARVVLVGWSMGAQIALQSYGRLSDRLAGLVLVSATPRFTAGDDFPHGLAAKEAEGMGLKVQRNLGRALEGFYGRLFAAGEQENHPLDLEIDKLLSSITPPDHAAVLDALDALARTDLRPLLPAISKPTLILNGALDRICLPQASSYLKEHIANAEQTVFPDSGHAPFLTRSHQFNNEIIRFARSVREQYCP